MENKLKSSALILTLVILTALAGAAQNKYESFPTLHGDKAVNELKQKGQYEFLMKAFKTADQEISRSVVSSPSTSTVFGQLAKIVAPDGASGDAFGNSVAISGGTAIIGAPGTNSGRGSAYVFVISGTTWTFQQKLTAADGTSNNFFGGLVAIDGDTAIVGAVGASSNRGGAYVFLRSGTTWSQQQKLTASDALPNDRFGVVAISGNTVAVGAYTKNAGSNQFQGAVYVFVRSGTTWTQQQKLAASDGTANDQFGYSVAISGETLITGTPFVNASSSPQGAAYVFVRSGTTWSQQQKLTSATGSSFGNSVSISGETVVVGDPGENSQHGGAFVYLRSGSVWNQQAHLLASDGMAIDNFANSVTISGEKIVVGSYLSRGTVNAQANGSAYIFSRTGISWVQQRKLTAADGAVADFFGESVAISGKNILVGADGDDIGANSDQGSVYGFSQRTDFDFDGDVLADLSVFRPSTNTWFAALPNGGTSVVQFGTSGDVPVPADYDGDGKTDICVFRENGFGDPNKSYFFILRSSDNTVKSEQFGRVGDNPRVVGDWDGDGKADLAVYRDGATTGAASNFYYRPSSQPGIDFNTVYWGISGDKPVTGDYDGDGKIDATVFRSSNAVWYVQRSSDNGFQATNWGISTDKPVARDFDGDGKVDLTVFRNGVWYILQSTNNQLQAINWGLAADTLVPADYDGDGKADIAIFRNGVWWILRSSDNQIAVLSFGANSDMPLPSLY